MILLPAALCLGVMLWPVFRYAEPFVSAGAAHTILLLVTLLAVAALLSYMLPPSRVRSVLHAVGAFFYPLFLTALVPLLALDILYYCKLDTGAWHVPLTFLAVLLALFTAGYFGAVTLRVKRYTAVLPEAAPIRLVLLSDLHLGYFTPGKLGQELAEAVLKEAPEAVLLAGDLFDDRFEGLYEARRERIGAGLRHLASAVPVYACEGNHDLMSPDARKEAFLEGCGIRLLYDESVNIKGTRFVFRRDAENEKRQGIGTLFPEDGIPTVVIDHTPDFYREAWARGAGLVLSGHTHGGQTFPGTLRYIGKRAHGYGFFREMDAQNRPRQLIITSGAGIYGCPVRLGAAREIVTVDIIPKEN